MGKEQRKPTGLGSRVDGGLPEICFNCVHLAKDRFLYCTAVDDDIILGEAFEERVWDYEKDTCKFRKKIK